MPIAPQLLRQAMGQFATGVTVITAEVDGAVHAMTANAITSVSLEPPLVLVCVGRQRAMHGVLERAGRYGINVLAADQEPVARFFARQTDQEPAYRFVQQPPKAPRLEGALAYLDCRVVERLPGGDHTIFLAEVEHAEVYGGDPLLFFGGRYARLASQATTPSLR
ncbi:MAG TPA: flavin reductase family protein [Thermaerobacter sp.]